MEVLKVIEERRSIRNFKNDNVNRELIEDILNCGRLAPSAKNKQPWYFVVLTEETKNRVVDMMINYTLKSKKSEERAIHGFNSSVNPTANAIKQAPILILIFREKDNNWIVGDNLSIGACVENMCLRATDLGIGSLWIRDIVYVADEVAKMLGHEDMELNCAVSIGYPNEFPKQRPRKKLKDIVEWYNE